MDPHDVKSTDPVFITITVILIALGVGIALAVAWHMPNTFMVVGVGAVAYWYLIGGKHNDPDNEESP